MGWYARNMAKLESSNRTIRFICPKRHLITHQATSWTHQLYKDKDTRAEAQELHHPDSATLLATITDTDTMKVSSFCETTHEHHYMHLHGDSIYMHIKYSDTQFQHTYDASNTNISTSLTYLGALFQHAPYRQSIGNDSFP